MVDRIDKETRRRNMQAVKGKKTKLESLVTKELWRRGFRFQKNNKDLQGKPDISIKKYKIVIFIDSCFWHMCEYHYKCPETNKEFWEKKISGNKMRDIDINAFYKAQNWHILRVWEHEIKENFDKTIEDISSFILKIKSM